MFVRRFDVPGKLLFPRNASAYAMLVNNAVMSVQKKNMHLDEDESNNWQSLDYC